MGWIRDEFERAHIRRFNRAIQDAKEAVAAMPAERREEHARRFQEAADQALCQARYHRPG